MTGTTQLPHAVNNFYDRTMLERARPLLVHTNWGQVRDIPKNGTNVIKFRRYGALATATTPLVEGVTPEGKDLSKTDVSATVYQYGDFVRLSDWVQLTTLDPILTETAEVLGEQAGDTLDELARGVLHTGTNVQYADATTPGSGANRAAVGSTDVLDADELKVGIRTLKNGNAKRINKMVSADTGYNTTPVMASFVGIIHPDATHIIQDLSGFESVEKYAGRTAVLPGEVGKYKDIRFVETTQAKIFAGEGGGGIDVYSTLILGMDAYGVSRISGNAMQNIVKPIGSAGSADPLNQRSTSGWKATFACVILNDNFLLRIEHAV